MKEIALQHRGRGRSSLWKIDGLYENYFNLHTIILTGNIPVETSNYFHAQPQKRHPTSLIATETRLSTKVDYSDFAFAAI